MSNQRFVAIVGAIIVALLAVLLVQRYQDCLAAHCSLLSWSRSGPALHLQYETDKK